jgi:hypothetical protein
MADFPKATRTKEKIVKMPNGWEKTTNIPGLPKTTRYRHFRGKLVVDLYHDRGSDKYTVERIEGDNYAVKKFRAKSLEKAQKLADLMIDTWEND